MKRYSFGKGERLRHRSLVEGLYSEGATLTEYPLRAKWRTLSNEELQNSFRIKVPAGIDRLQMMVTIPKRKRKRAVDRVLLRRRVREAYRLNRLSLKEAVERNPQIGSLSIGFVWLHEGLMDYAKIERKMKRILQQIENKISIDDEGGKESE